MFKSHSHAPKQTRLICQSTLAPILQLDLKWGVFVEAQIKLIFFWSFLTIFGHFWHFFLLFQACYRKNTVVKIHWQPISRTIVYLTFPRFQKMTKLRAFLCFLAIFGFFGRKKNQLNFHLWGGGSGQRWKISTFSYLKASLREGFKKKTCFLSTFCG